MLRSLNRLFVVISAVVLLAPLAHAQRGWLDGVGGNAVLDGSAIWEEDGWVTVTPGIGSQNGGVFTEQVGSGSYSQATINFDIRLSETSENGGADGYGFAMLPVSQYGSTATGTNPAFSEEVNLAGAFGVGFDTFDNGGEAGDLGDRLNESSISIHYNGALVQNQGGPQADPPFNLESLTETKQFNINLFINRNGAGGSNVTATMTDLGNGNVIVPFAGVDIPGMDIQEYRLGFRGRTGGAWNKQEISNITITEDNNAPISVLFGVPEPAGASLLGMASLMLLGLRRRM